MSQTSSLPVAIVGAGPVGLAAAAQLAERNIPFLVFEAGERVARNLAALAHVRLFSPWRFNIDHAARRLLEAGAWCGPDPDDLPTAGELVDRYLVPLSRTPQLAPQIRLASSVIGISRSGHDKLKTDGRASAPFLLQVRQGDSAITEHLASAVLDASGTWNQPNPIGSHGLPAMGERENAHRIAYGMPDILGRDRTRYAGKTVLVVGAGHSAAGNLLALAELAFDYPGMHIVWAVRGRDLRRLFGGGSNDGLPARGALGIKLQRLVTEGRLEVRYAFRIQRLAQAGLKLKVLAQDATQPPIEGVDEVIVSTGSRPDLSISRELRLQHDRLLESTEALAPLIDPNVHSCGTVRPHGHRELQHPEPGYYALGAKSYGRAPNFLMATGYEQARSVVAALAGDYAAADNVQLELPQTGICSTDHLTEQASAACCGGPAEKDVTACCALDEERKAKGAAGCGCGPGTEAPRRETIRPAVSAPKSRSCCGG